ncbi:ABC transporter permease [Kutzneria albida]|uniref:Sodium ABC transporter permease n=1 Tax=Kutzneria albida DSM 43870 TaxID=1449976 RepID=W5VZJ8_9PSEU|nr:ABC transporter permease [Kutzneria albida]AHH94002.1 sodium ABC transporter permease [Kutzneria albida DSM 43870]
MTTLSPTRTVGLVARREFTTRVRSKAFVLSTLLIIGLLAGYVLLFSFIGKSSAIKVGLAGQSTGISAPLTAITGKLGKEVQTSTVNDQNDGEQQVRSGKLDVLVSGALDAPKVTVKSSLDPALQQALTELVRQQAIQGALAQNGLKPNVLDAAQSVTVRPKVLEPEDPEQGQKTVLAYIVGMVLFISIQTFGVAVAQGVVEEKSSRVVEILLATIRPWQLLLGKVIGIGASGLIQVLAIGVAGVALGRASGMLTLTDFAVGAVASAVGWYLVGFFLYAVLLAAAGSLVSRQEELQSVITPVTLLPVLGFVVGINLTLRNPADPISAVLSMVPFFTPTLMPARIALGVAPLWQVVLALVLAVGCIALFTWLGGKVYGNAVLRTGSRVKLRDALR